MTDFKATTFTREYRRLRRIGYSVTIAYREASRSTQLDVKIWRAVAGVLILACVYLGGLIDSQHMAVAEQEIPRKPNTMVQIDGIIYDSSKPGYMMARCMNSKRGRVWIDVEGKMIAYDCRAEWYGVQEEK